MGVLCTVHGLDSCHIFGVFYYRLVGEASLSQVHQYRSTCYGGVPWNSRGRLPSTSSSTWQMGDQGMHEEANNFVKGGQGFLPQRLTSFSNAGRECSSQNASGSPSVERKVSVCPATCPHSTWKERQQVPIAHCLQRAQSQNTG